MHSAIGDLDIFESQWEKLSIEKKAFFIDEAASLSPKSAVLPILAGLTSDHPVLTDKAKESLSIVQTELSELLNHPFDKDHYTEVLLDAASICVKVYSCIRPEMDPGELEFFFRTLLGLGGKGAYFAFKVLSRGMIPGEEMEKILLTIPEPDRLAFVDQYLQASPGVRLKFGRSFKILLESIQNKEAVIQFYAFLFDRQRDADPFLNNIGVDLRDPDQIIAEKVRSPFPEQRIMGLKALSMMVTKISSDLLIELFSEDESELVRIAVYNVIESSPVGLYQDLCYPILQFFYTRREREALHAFKAMVVTGKFTPHRLLKLMETKYPSLLPAIYAEISDLSRFSFFIIQDIALNKEKYLESNFDANLACILGMIKKRPERIVKILDRLRTTVDLAPFIQKTKKLLAKEKASIEMEFDSITQRVHEQSRSLPKSILAANRERIESLGTRKKPAEEPCFEDQVIMDAKFSQTLDSLSSLSFGRSIIFKCDLSKAVFFETIFRKSILYNVDLREAQFDTVNFDHAVFINVDATGARFKNCSFENVSLYNCDFSGADLSDSPFLNATISKTTFNKTDLSGSCFAFSHLSKVSFLDSILNQVDFSDAKARFCQFRQGGGLDLKTENLDFNARKFQLSSRDMPPLEKPMVAEVNKQIFHEFIHYGENKFLRQNQVSLLTAFDIFNPRQTDLFQLIPLLLHENIVFPGIEEISFQTPCGIWNYLPDPETLEILDQYRDGERVAIARCSVPFIEGLFTMGSVGSVAQSSDSDIDYWVCIHEENFSSEEMALFRKKLAILENMAMEQFDTKVTFFIVDILKARQNDFGAFTGESSGSAQARLLKEEFYRTMIHVAGKIPLWAVLPSAISLNFYEIIRSEVILQSGASKYIDLGDINAIPTNEYFGASLWQMFKCVKSPFKSVIKMALLEKFLREYGKERLLCNKYKDEWMNSGAHLKLAQNDSYYVLMENLLAYFRSIKDEDSVSLLLTCFFLKLGISKYSQLNDTVFGFRRVLVEHCLRQWGWTKLELFRIGRFKTWDYGDIAEVSSTIREYMVDKCKLVNKQSASQVKISTEDRTLLGRKVHIEFSKQAGRIERDFILSKRELEYHRLHLRFTGENRGTWELFNRGTKESDFKEEVLARGNTVEEICAWLILNQVYEGENDIYLIPNPTYVTFEDIQNLYGGMKDCFLPALEEGPGFQELLGDRRMTALFVCVDFYALKRQNHVAEFTMIYLNSWGEMFHETVVPDWTISGQREIERYVIGRLGITQLPQNTSFYFPKQKKKWLKGIFYCEDLEA